MKVCGFTVVKNAIHNDYPVVESIKSALPLCDHFLVALGNSDDNTEQVISEINSPKVEVVHTQWPENFFDDPWFLSKLTNEAFDLIPDEYDWCLYLQSDEVLHENDYDELKKEMTYHNNNPDVDGLIFNWYHFWGSYCYYGWSRKWYRRDVRIIKNNKDIRSWHDAQGFRLKNGGKITGAITNARIYHYGWVKNLKSIYKKIEKSPWASSGNAREKKFSFESDYDNVRIFKGTHPGVMKERISQFPWQIDIDPQKKRLKLKNRILLWVEEKTGCRLFENQHFYVYGNCKRRTNILD